MENYLRPIAYASFIVVLLLEILSVINKEIVIPLVIIIILFIIATVIYKKEGFQRLKIFFIVLFYMVLAMVILFTSGIENIPEPWRAIIGISIMTIMVVLIALTIFKLNLLYVDVEDNDIWLK